MLLIMLYANRLTLFSFACCLLLFACNTGKNPAQKNSQPTTPGTWDTAKIKAAVNDYLRTHEKYYTLIDSIRYDIEPLNRSRILYDQGSYYFTIATVQDRQNFKEYIIPPGSTAKPPARFRSPYHDSAAFYYQRSALPQDADLLGFRVSISYRLSDVMLSYSDFTPYLFYFDTGYHRLNKSDFLHYTSIPVDPPNESGFYFDTPYPYVPK